MKEKNTTTRSINVILFIILVVVISLLVSECQDNTELKSKISVSEVNERALNDSLRVEKNNLGKEIYLKNSLLTSNEKLSSLNSDLSKELDKVKGRVLFLQKMKSTIKVDTQYMNNEVHVYPDSRYGLEWSKDTVYSNNNYKKIKGVSFFKIDSLNKKVFPGFTRIDREEIGLSLVTGIREKDKNLEIFIEPNFPGMKITEIEGAIIDPQKSDVLKKAFPLKKWSVGPSIGIGVSTGYSLLGIRTVIGVNFGISIQRVWFRF